MRSQNLVLCILICVSIHAQSLLAAPGDLPNMVLIIADDMNWNDCGTYGHPRIRTPNIDRLAKDGMRFDRAYLTASSCSPSRASMISGKYPHNTGAEQLHWPLPKGTITFVDRLRRAGYYTAAAGKWHLGNAVKHHFDKVYEASTSGFQLPAGEDQTEGRTSTAKRQMIAKKPSGCEDWVIALRSREKNKPFFMWLAALDPHRAYQRGSLVPPHELDDVVVPPHLPDTPEVREDLRLYYDEIGRLDAYVGKVVTELDAQGVTSKTLIVFISDNGRPFPRDKTTLYEGGIKTPWIVKWPGQVEPSTHTSSMVSSLDLASTFLEVANLKIPATFEGTSFLPILKNPKRQTRDYVFAEDHWHDYEDHGRAVIGDRFKLIRNDYFDLAATPSADAGRSPTWQTMRKMYDHGKLNALQRACFQAPRPKFELFDLEADPCEARNLAGRTEFADVERELNFVLDEWSTRTGDYLPSKRTPDEFDRRTGEPDHSVRVRPRRSKKEMFGTNGKY